MVLNNKSFNLIRDSTEKRLRTKYPKITSQYVIDAHCSSIVYYFSTDGISLVKCRIPLAFIETLPLDKITSRILADIEKWLA